MRLVALALFWLAIIGCSAFAQSRMDLFETWSRPTVGGTKGIQDTEALPGFQASEGDQILRHRDFAGQPCLEVSGFPRAQAIEPKLYDDVVTVANSCPQRIAIKVCYYQSEDCIPMEVAGGESKEVVLGTQPSLPGTQPLPPDFRFEFREKF